MNPADAKAVVTGGASGLGAAVVQGLRAAGGQVVVLDRDQSDGLVVDVTDEQAVGAALDQATDQMSGLNVAVNCAGIATAEKTLGRDGPHRQDSFEKTVAINLNGTTIRLDGSLRMP